MTWLIKIIISNPTILVLLLLATFGLGFSTGGSFSWYVQSVRLDKANVAKEKVEQEFSKYRIDQQTAFLKLEEKNRANAKESGRMFEAQKKELEKANKSGETYKRCVTAGKCDGLRVKPNLSCATNNSVQTNAGTDEGGSDAISVIGGSTPPVVIDCSETTLTLNRLQSAIEGQPGY